jgi:hypothetical protein
MSLLAEGGHSQTRGNKEFTAFYPECGDFASLSFTNAARKSPAVCWFALSEEAHSANYIGSAGGDLW